MPYQPYHVRGWKWKWECGAVCARAYDDLISTRGTLLSTQVIRSSSSPGWTSTRQMSQWVGCLWQGTQLLGRKGLSLSLLIAVFLLGIGDVVNTSAVRQSEGQGEGWEIKDSYNFPKGAIGLTLWPLCKQTFLWEFFPAEIFRLAFAELCTVLNYF